MLVVIDGKLGTFKTLAAAKRHESAVQYFKRH
jgi:hypothetical protein